VIRVAGASTATTPTNPLACWNIFFFGLAWLFFAAQTGGADSFSQAWGGAKWPILAGAAWYVIAEIDRNLHERKIKKTADKQGINR